jgi:hypothetical protein
MRALLLLAVLLLPATARAQAFTFFALGDMPYAEADRPRVDNLIALINAADPAFTIHVGDTKSGGSPCTDATIERSKAQLDSFAGALIYSVGDNEWTDCHRRGMDPNERLAFVRRLHFPTAQSLGQRPITLERQADVMPQYATYVENSRWRFNNILFVAVHIPGSNNNKPSIIFPGDEAEFAARDAANQAWIADSFATAAREGAAGIVFAYQADMWEPEVPRDPAKSGFTATLANFATGASAFGKPVLLIHGDSHRLVVDKPIVDATGATVANAVRLMVMGEKEVHAVRVTVDPARPGLFTCTAFLVPDNPVGAASVQAGTSNCDGTPRTKP